MKLRHPKDGRVHFSELKALRKSPAHYRHAIEESRTITRPMIVGSVADGLVFGGRNVALYPGKVRNGKEWEAFKLSNEGKTLCIQSEYDDAKGAADAVLADPVARRLLDGCEYQRVMAWEAYGLECAAGVAGERGGFDAWHEKRGYILDLKVTASTQPEDFQRHAFKMQWHAQAAWYLDGAKALAIDVRDFYLIGVEANPPHCVTVLHVTQEALDMGRKEIALWTEKLKACEAADAWPGYAQDVLQLEVPAWSGLEGLGGDD